jgi:hypothetical protein
VWWLFFLSAGVRRLVDYHGGWNWASPINLAPLLAASVSIYSLRFAFDRRDVSYLAPLAMIAVAIFYGYCIGVQEAGFIAASYAAFNWMLPPIVCYHIILHYRYVLEFKDILIKTFVWGALLTGCYGLIQYFYLPGWDANWLIRSQIFGQMLSGGLPYPFYVRVFSTMNAPAPFASVMMASLLIMLNCGHRLRWAAAAPALMSLLLSIVRTAWFGLAVGWIYTMLRLRGTAHFRQLATVVLVACLSVPLLAVEPISQLIGRRFESIAKLSDDSSYRARNLIYENVSEQVFKNFAGNGLGVSGTATKLNNQGAMGDHGDMDSGLLEIPYNLGWPGGFLFLMGVGWFLHMALGRMITLDRTWTVTCGSIVIAALAELPLTNSIYGTIGLVFWCFLGMILAEQLFVENQMSNN